MKTVVLGVSGSISAYKAADIAHGLVKRGVNVEVIMTEGATKFVTPLTLQVLSKHDVHTDTFVEPNPAKVNHIELASAADLFLIAPASADTVAKIANGFAHDLLSATAIALPKKSPKLVAPAMNTNMYESNAFQRNLETMKQDGYIEIEPKSSMLACGVVGKGALANVDEIIDRVMDALK
jgi:phosphopantothenoylcysteine decarboxylase